MHEMTCAFESVRRAAKSRGQAGPSPPSTFCMGLGSLYKMYGRNVAPTIHVYQKWKDDPGSILDRAVES